MAKEEGQLTPANSRKEAAKKPRKLSKNDGLRLIVAIREELTTTPETDPDEALRRIQKINRLGLKVEDPVITMAYREILMRSGRNPDEWTRYTAVRQPRDLRAGFTEQDMEALVARYPKELEFFVTQGTPSPRSQVDVERNGLAPYGIIDHFWAGFVRKRPDSPKLT